MQKCKSANLSGLSPLLAAASCLCKMAACLLPFPFTLAEPALLRRERRERRSICNPVRTALLQCIHTTVLQYVHCGEARGAAGSERPQAVADYGELLRRRFAHKSEGDRNDEGERSVAGVCEKKNADVAIFAPTKLFSFPFPLALIEDSFPQRSLERKGGDFAE